MSEPQEPTESARPEPGELYRGRPAWRYYLWVYVVGAIVSAIMRDSGGSAPFVVALITVALVAFFRFRRLYIVNEDGISTQVGLIGRVLNDMRYERIQTITLKQSMMERLLGVGDIVLVSAGEIDGGVEFKGLSRPTEVLRLIKAQSQQHIG